MVAGDMSAEAVRVMLMNLTPTTVVDMMEVRSEERYKGKGTNQDMIEIRMSVTAPDSSVMLITEV